MFNRKDIRIHHDAINEIIRKYCEENGLAFDPKSISYTENEINYKCTIRATDESGNVTLDPRLHSPGFCGLWHAPHRARF